LTAAAQLAAAAKKHPTMLPQLLHTKNLPSDIKIPPLKFIQKYCRLAAGIAPTYFLFLL
jgi:hypothetical protein